MLSRTLILQRTASASASSAPLHTRRCFVPLLTASRSSAHSLIRNYTSHRCTQQRFFSSSSSPATPTASTATNKSPSSAADASSSDGSEKSVESTSANTETISPASTSSLPSGSTSTSSTSASTSTKSPSSRIPTDSELLSPGQRKFFRATDWILGGLLGFAIGNLIMHYLEHPEVIDEVLAAAEEDELIQAKVGKPLSGSIFWGGNVNPTNASLTIPVTGPKGSATLHARALYEPDSKQWKLMLLQASFDATEGAQKHSLDIPVRYVIQPRYVSPAEAERIKQKHLDMMKKLEAVHAQKGEQAAATK